MSKLRQSFWKLVILVAVLMIGVGGESLTANAAFEAPYYNIKENGGKWDGNNYVLDGKVVKDAFFCDGTYTYFLQADGTPMKNRLTYHPDGEHIIYFDEKGHEVFDHFKNVKQSIAGQPVDDLCYFNTFGYMYVDVLTYDVAGVNLYYANSYGVMERNGLFEFSDGYRGFANEDGTLVKDTFMKVPDGDTYYFGSDAKAVKGVITDLEKYYYMSKRDGHLMGTFETQKEAEEMASRDELDISFVNTDMCHYVNTLLTLVDGKDSQLVKWSSSDSNIITVINNQPIAMSPGSVVLTANVGGEKKDFEIDVHPMNKAIGLSEEEITLFPGESFQIGLGGTMIAKWSVSDENIATVSDTGMVTAKKLGETVVSATCEGETAKCTVKVIQDDGSYIEPLHIYEYEASAKKFVKEYEKFYLIADGGICFPKDFETRVNTVMSAIEKETGYSFYPSDERKIIIEFGNKGMGNFAYAHQDGVVLAAMDSLYDENSGPHVILHELLHVVQMRNSGYLGNALTEGFAEYYTEKILEKLPYYSNYHEEWNQYTVYETTYGDTLNEENMREHLLETTDSHPISYYFTKYLIATYGMEQYQKIINNLPEERNEENILRFIEKQTSADVAKKFAVWMKSVKEPDEKQHKVGKGESVHIYVIDNGWDALSISSAIKYEEEVTIDYTTAIEYAQKIMGKKIKVEHAPKVGLFNSTIGCADADKVIFYDATGKIVAETKGEIQYPDGYTKIVVKGGDTVWFTIYEMAPEN